MLLANLTNTLRRALVGQARYKSTLTVHDAETECRQLALPLAFMAWNATEAKVLQRWVCKFGRVGYSSLVIELDPEGAKQHILAQGNEPTSSAIIAHLESEISSLLRTSSAASFPPFLIASSLATIPAQAYVSSHPLSALLLHSPVPATKAHNLHPIAFPTPLAEFDFEPGFPIAVMHKDGGKALNEERLVREFDEEDVQRLKGGLDEKGWTKVMEWMDQMGL